MADRSFWKGYLKLSLVTCPVTMAPAATESERVRFHILNRKTGNRIQSQSIDSVTGKPVEEGDEVKGYPTGPDKYVILEEEEIDSVALESTHTIDVQLFCPRSRVDWIWYDKPHFLMPDDPVGEEAFAVIREAMAATDMVGLSRLVLYRRQRAVLLEPRGKGIVLWTLRYGDEVREPVAVPHAKKSVDSSQLKLLKALIDEKTDEWDTDLLKDPVQDRLLEIISNKKQGRRRIAKPSAPPAHEDNVIDIMDALRRSLASEKRPSHRR